MPSSSIFRFTAALWLCLSIHALFAQNVQSANGPDDGESALATNNNIGPSGIIPVQKGFNASLISTSQHDSVAGWSSLLTPNVAYRLNKYLSGDVSVPAYMYVIVTSNSGTAAKPVTKQSAKHALLGDTALALHLDAPLGHLATYNFTPTVSFPTGNDAAGLGAGQVTYDFNNHFEASTKFSPFVELGIGDTSSLLNRRTARNQISVGTQAHFQAGLSVDLPRDIECNVAYYEQLPLGDQNIYTTRTTAKKTVTKKTGTTGLAEDNGLNLSLDVPLQRHVIVSGFFNKSVRQHNDVAGFSITFLLRGKPVE